MGTAHSRLPVVAIDGPAGAGKSTVARLLAARLGLTYIDTGAMYRGVALAAAQRGIHPDDGEALAGLARSLEFRFAPHPDRPRLLLDGEDVAEAIRTPEVSRASSEVSRWPGVRGALVAAQQRLGAGGGVVMEGRDVGTVVFPDAEVKIFLTASARERARRRTHELESGGRPAQPEEVLQELLDRDRRDTEREHSPLRAAPDSVEVCTDGLSIEQVVERLAEIVRNRRP